MTSWLILLVFGFTVLEWQRCQWRVAELAMCRFYVLVYWPFLTLSVSLSSLSSRGVLATINIHTSHTTSSSSSFSSFCLYQNLSLSLLWDSESISNHWVHISFHHVTVCSTNVPLLPPSLLLSIVTLPFSMSMYIHNISSSSICRHVLALVGRQYIGISLSTSAMAWSVSGFQACLYSVVVKGNCWVEEVSGLPPEFTSWIQSCNV